MTALDYLIIAVLVLSTAISLFRGFLKESISLVTWVMAFWCSWKFAPLLQIYLEPYIAAQELRIWAARILILIAVLILGGIINWVISLVVHQTGLSGTDRSIGMVFGFARGVVLVGVLVILLELIGFEQNAWWRNSKLIPYAAPVADALENAAEDGLEYIEGTDIQSLQSVISPES